MKQSAKFSRCAQTNTQCNLPFMLGRASHIMKDTPGMVVWLGGVEKGGRGEDESSVQLFNKWRNSSALENSLKKQKKGLMTHSVTRKVMDLCKICSIYPESFLYLSAMESLCGWMRVWTARSKSFLQKQRWSWAMGSAGTTSIQG